VLPRSAPYVRHSPFFAPFCACKVRQDRSKNQTAVRFMRGEYASGSSQSNWIGCLQAVGSNTDSCRPTRRHRRSKRILSNYAWAEWQQQPRESCHAESKTDLPNPSERFFRDDLSVLRNDDWSAVQLRNLSRSSYRSGQARFTDSKNRLFSGDGDHVQCHGPFELNRRLGFHTRWKSSGAL
jgi:hypothetical protein